MKKNIIILSLLLVSASFYSQVGIKTPDPKASLDIVGNTLGMKTGANSGSWENIWLQVDNRKASINASSAEDGLQFNVGSNGKGTYGDDQVLRTVATMTSDGNLGIGTTTPQNRIDLGSDAPGATNNPAGKKLAVYNTSTASSFYGLGVSSNTLQIHAGSAADGEPGMVLTRNGNAGIGAPSPNSAALLELNSINKGFLPPRMTTAQRDAINPKLAGLTIYNTSLNCMQYWNTQAWKGSCGTTPPTPDLSANCTGWRLPYKTNNQSATGTVKGTSLTATFSDYGNVKHSTNGPNRCGISLTPADIYWLGDDRSQNTKMKIRFSRGVTNFKVIQAGTHARETFTFTLKYKGVAVSPTVTVSPVGGCNDQFQITKPASNQVEVKSLNNWNWTVDGTGIIYNIGGVWFDEIDITALETTNQQNGSSFNFCVGDVL